MSHADVAARALWATGSRARSHPARGFLCAATACGSGTAALLLLLREADGSGAAAAVLLCRQRLTACRFLLRFEL
jgi:hypothetical protein